MLYLSLGDVHGRVEALQIAKENIDKVDKIIFIGDYVDSFDVLPVMILHNLKEIVEFKKQYPDKVELLLGNHDVQYIIKDQVCSGYQAGMLWDYKSVFMDNINLFKIAHQHDNIIFSHAGIHKGWYAQFLEPMMEEGELIADALNELWAKGIYKNKWDPLFNVGISRGGHSKVGGPLWLDKSVASKKPLDNYHQVVGHTALDEIKTIFPHNNNGDTSITFIDVLGGPYPNKYKKVKTDVVKYYLVNTDAYLYK